jgi:hypothetical protein
MVRDWTANRLTNQWVLHRGHNNGLGLCTAVYETTDAVAHYTAAHEPPAVEKLAGSRTSLSEVIHGIPSFEYQPRPSDSSVA